MFQITGYVCFGDALFLYRLFCNTESCLNRCLGITGLSRSSLKQEPILQRSGTGFSLYILPHLLQDSIAL